jgi:hypothetical protein
VPTISIADILKENEELRKTFNKVSDINLELRKEIEFLKERNKDLRQKTWYSVYEENLKLNQQIEKYKYAINENCELRKEIEILKDALKSVQTFTKQFA